MFDFTQVCWFPLEALSATRNWQAKCYLEPDMLAPDALVPDYLRMIEEGEHITDDLIRGIDIDIEN